MRLKADHHRPQFRRRNADPDDRRGSHARRHGHPAQRFLAAAAPSTSRPTAPSSSTRPPRRKANAQIMQVIGSTLQAAQGLLQTGILPPPMIINLTLEMIKMLLHPVRHSRGVVDLIDGYQEMLGAYMQMDPTGALMQPPPPPPPPGGPPRARPASTGPQRGANGKARRVRHTSRPRRPAWAALRPREPDLCQKRRKQRDASQLQAKPRSSCRSCANQDQSVNQRRRS